VSATVSGWIVDPALAGGGLAPVKLEVQVDYQTVVTATANQSRPDLVKQKIAPNPDHGFSVEFQIPALENANANANANAKRIVEVWAIVDRVDDTASGPFRVRVEGSPKCVCGGAACAC
jgi:hypothetical protein